jgi:hypothetical protein
MTLEKTTPHTLKHLEAQPAAAWQSFVFSTGMVS